MRGNLPSTLLAHGGCPLPTSFSEDGCSICSSSLIYEVTATLARGFYSLVRLPGKEKVSLL